MISFNFEGVVEYKAEDSGCSLIAEVDENDMNNTMFIRIHSWDKTKTHDQARKLEGKKVRINIEVIG